MIDCKPMRVQVFYSPGVARSGGGHTYFDDIFRAFIASADQTSHQFVILGYDERPDLTLPPNVEWVTLRRSWPRRLIERGYHQLEQMYHRSAGGTSGHERPHQRHIREKSREYKIDMTLSWMPGVDQYYLPSITTVWDLGHRVHPYFPELTANGEWDRREAMYRKLSIAARVITGTKVCKEQIVRYYHVDPERVVVIPFPTPGFALEEACTNGDGECELARKLPPQYLFYPAQFWPHKNHIGLLDALRIVKTTCGSCPPLVLCGSDKGNLQHVRAAVQELGLADDVHILGYVSRRELVWLYRHALALAFVTFLGPDNLPPLEAFALGCPVVASQVDGAHEQLGDAAVLVDPANALHIAHGIQYVWQSPAARVELIHKGHARARGFTSRDYIAAVFQLLDEFEPICRCYP
jgi:glycosyltransferase involved in cell wall biosynthesis